MPWLSIPNPHWSKSLKGMNKWADSTNAPGTLKLTAMAHDKLMVGRWNFLLGPIFEGYISFREGISWWIIVFLSTSLPREWIPYCEFRLVMIVAYCRKFHIGEDIMFHPIYKGFVVLEIFSMDWREFTVGHHVMCWKNITLSFSKP